MVAAGGATGLAAAFLWLFRRTEYSGADQLAGGENVFFRLDPLVGAAAMLAGRQFMAVFWPAAIVVALTLVFGRFFCGWVCPLGTLLDGFHFMLRPIHVGGTNRLYGADAVLQSNNSRGLNAARRRAWPTPAMFSYRGAAGRRLRVSAGRFRRSLLAAGARADILGRSDALPRRRRRLRLGRRWLGDRRF